MRELEEDDDEMYAKHFAGYVENGIDADELESVLEKVHEAIRADPTRAALRSSLLSIRVSATPENPPLLSAVLALMPRRLLSRPPTMVMRKRKVEMMRKRIPRRMIRFIIDILLKRN